MKLLSLATLLFGHFPLTTSAEPPRPNIILFFVDDLGWYDVGYRNDQFETPHIDQLAKDGMDFQQAYIPSPTCSPSRAALVTGQHPARLRIVRHIPHGPKFGGDVFGRTKKEFHLWPKDPTQFPSRNWLPLETTTYAEALKTFGYHSLFIGKWHLGHEPYYPIHHGFDRQIGTSNFGHPRSYYPPFFKNGETLLEEKEKYLTDRLTEDTVSFLKNHDRSHPFMISLWYYNVHGPHVGRRDLVSKFEKKGLQGKQAHYAAMVAAVDESIGKVRATLADQKLADNTVIIFLSDQGSLFGNAALRGHKKKDTLCEGGARVPLIIHWPGVTKAGSQNFSIIQSTDLFPTLVEIAGGNPKNDSQLDGLSLVSTLKTNRPIKRPGPIFGYRAYQDLYASVREDEWKLLAYRSGKTELYHLGQDPSEKKNVATENPTIVSHLKDALAKWEREMGVADYSGVQ